MDLIRDVPQWRFTGFPGFGPRHLRVWRETPSRVVAVVTEQTDIEGNAAGTSILEAHGLVLAQLRADHPNDLIEYVVNQAHLAENYDWFNRVELNPDGSETMFGLLTNEVIDRLGADGMYRRYAGKVYEISED